MFLTVREIADLASVSKTTIQKAIKHNSIKADKFENNRQLFTIENSKRIIEIVSPSFDFLNSPTFANQLENSQTFENIESENSQTNLQNFANSKINSKNIEDEAENSQTEIYRDYVETLKKQLEEKEQQLKVKDKQINDLNDRLAEALQTVKDQNVLISQQQHLSLMDKTTAAATDTEEKEEVIIVDTDNISGENVLSQNSENKSLEHNSEKDTVAPERSFIERLKYLFTNK